VFKGTRVPVRSIAAMLDEGTSEVRLWRSRAGGSGVPS
jgi:uncharacterized protein (DUF433 family)